jgi:hypothetical protein
VVAGVIEAWVKRPTNLRRGEDVAQHIGLV